MDLYAFDGNLGAATLAGPRVETIESSTVGSTQRGGSWPDLVRNELGDGPWDADWVRARSLALEAGLMLTELLIDEPNADEPRGTPADRTPVVTG